MSLLTCATGRIFFLSNNSYSKLTLNCSRVELYYRHSLNVLSFNKHLCSEHSSARTDSSDSERNNTKYIKYDDLLAQRRCQAQRSVLIEVQSEKSCSDVYSYCSQFGEVNNLFHYTTTAKGRHFTLIEFATQECIATVLANTTHVNYDQVIPVQSPMLWFRNPVRYTEKRSTPEIIDSPIITNACKVYSNAEIIKKLSTAQNVSDQMIKLHQFTKLNDTGVRLRFFTASQIEKCFSSLFPNMGVFPFGSSVNGFGKQGCDLDLCSIFEKDATENTKTRLVFQTKSVLVHERLQLRRLLETMADVMSLFIPGVTNVKKILQAQVPIVKFDHILTGIECDFAMSNFSAYYMSELLYMYGEIDWRLRPLTFAVRKWAQVWKLTSEIPGYWITNFSLSLMVIFFMQQKHLLPSLNQLKLNATKEDSRIVDTCIDCTFVRDITKLPKNSKNKSSETLEELLKEFFAFYSAFDFETKALSVREGRPIVKPEYRALYICNPLETSLNVSKNVRFEELERIKDAMRGALWLLQYPGEDRTGIWGLVNLLVEKNTSRFSSVDASSMSLNIEDLFKDDADSMNTFGKRDKRREAKKKTKFS